MRQLHLIRHAKSSWNDAGQRDFDRPLNARGLRDAPVMAARLAAALPPARRLVSSPARRAWQTAILFAESLGVAQDAIRSRPEIYEASAGTLLALLNALADADDCVLLFGHNPGVSALARLLTPCPFIEMPTAGIASLAFDAPRWGDVVPGAGRLLAYRYPRQDQPVRT